MTDLPHLRLYRRGAALAWVLGPALILADNLIHPKEYPPGHEAHQLADIAGHYTQWQVAHLLGLAAIFLFVPAALGLAFVVRRRAPLAGLVGGALSLIGALGFASVIGLDGFAWGVVSEVYQRGDHATAQLVLHDLQHSQWGYAYYAPGAGILLGLIVLGLAGASTGALSGVVGLLLAAAGVMVGLETTIHSNSFFVAGAAVLLAAGVGVAAHLWRMSDDFYAGMGSSASAP
ncbi:MAG: hypothetical protein QOE65_228 [Solirubrobacteraceae bacterium]|jgi:hypothetical protein|nr:hypothetical protein [Solirubrobacteraceae bacterium]